MKINFEPITSNENAYIDNIVKALKHNGAIFCNENIQGKTAKALNYLKLLFSKEKIIFHFNWIENITAKESIKSQIMEKAYLLFANIAHICGKKLVWTMHNTVSHHCADINRTENFLRKWIKKMDLIIVHCNESREYLIDKYNFEDKKICVVPHGKYETYKVNDDRLIELKERYSIKDEIIFMYFGKLDDYKNIPLLIQVLKN